VSAFREHAVLDVGDGESAAFEAALRQALPLMAASDGFLTQRDDRSCPTPVGHPGRMTAGTVSLAWVPTFVGTNGREQAFPFSRAFCSEL
jgi:hypothetical protein